MIEKIISGGQIGADIAGLRAAKEVGLQTGGWIPKGFKTLDGCRPEYADMYGLIETESPMYPPRTKRNVRDSDATVRFAYNFHTNGERLTHNELIKQNKPWFDVIMYDDYMTAIPLFWDWLFEVRPKVLNVAGNARFDIEDRVTNYLIETLVREANNGNSP